MTALLNESEEIENVIHKPLAYHEIPQLKKAYNLLIKLSTKFDQLNKFNEINEKERNILVADIITILELIGEMTDPLFAIRDDIEAKYFAKVKDPEIARKLFLNEYEALHKPYDYVKNFGWNLYYKMMNLNDDE